MWSMSYLCPLVICQGRRRPSYPLFPVKPFIATFCFNIQGVSKLLGQTSGMSSPHKNKKKKVSISTRSQTLIFGGRAPTFVRLQSFLISVTKAFFMPDKPHITTARHLNICDTPRSHVSMPTLIQLEGNLGICCQL